ncbi:necrosis inducing-like protein npp1 type [Moniliophthora roreri]|nr:necrosis inducing-like protein npp1 type [Moniliophthora roreri]
MKLDEGTLKKNDISTERSNSNKALARNSNPLPPTGVAWRCDSAIDALVLSPQWLGLLIAC